MAWVLGIILLNITEHTLNKPYLPTRILVCISANPLSKRLIQIGHQLANENDTVWHVLYVENIKSNLTEKDRTQLNNSLKSAESLGARVDMLTGRSISNVILKYARQNKLTMIIIGQSLQPRWREITGESIVGQVIRNSGEIDVYVIKSNRNQVHIKSKPLSFEIFRSSLSIYLQTMGVIVLTTFLSALINAIIPLNPTNLVMFYILAVVIVALRTGYGSAIITSILSVIIFNFFFVPPRYTFQVADAEYFITFLALLGVGLVIAGLASRSRNQTNIARQREHETAQLYSLSRELAMTTELDVVLKLIIRHVQQSFRYESAILIVQNSHLTLVDKSQQFQQTLYDATLAQQALHEQRKVRQPPSAQSNASILYVPLVAAERTIGILALETAPVETLETQRLLDAFANQSALALEAVLLHEDAQQAKLLREKEKLQTAVLNSVSHDLRTPLVSITGTISSLLDKHSKLTPEAQHDLLVGAYNDAERLNRLVGNLLDMSRLEAGSVTLKRDFYHLDEVIGIVRVQLKNRLTDRTLLINFHPDLPMIWIDPILIVQVFVNLIDNAIKYSADDTIIELHAEPHDDAVHIHISDRGIGIPEAELHLVFKKFFRASTTERYVGSGLGLSICKSIIEAHHGKITVNNRPAGGTQFSIELPIKDTLNEQ